MPLQDELRSVTLQKPLVPELAPPSGFPAPLIQLRGIAKVDDLLQLPNIDLTPEEAGRVRSFQEARLVLGAAAAAIMVCTVECPKIGQCPLAMARKAPAGWKCPLEVHYAKERFVRWAQEIGSDPDSIGETERIAVSQLVAIDVQEQRCLDIVAIGEDTKLTQKSVKDCDTNGVPIAWEIVIHQNLQFIEILHNRRRAILKDWELTPEAKTKKARGVMKSFADLASKTTDNADRLRNAIKKGPRVININPSN